MPTLSISSPAELDSCKPDILSVFDLKVVIPMDQTYKTEFDCKDPGKIERYYLLGV